MELGFESRKRLLVVTLLKILLGTPHPHSFIVHECAEYDYTRNIAARVGAEIGSHGWLRQLFKDLLHEIDSCLEAVGFVVERQNESAGAGVTATEERPFGWAPFLVVLKGLHAIAKLYEGAMVDLLDMLLVRRISLNILIRQSRWQVITLMKTWNLISQNQSPKRFNSKLFFIFLDKLVFVIFNFIIT